MSETLQSEDRLRRVTSRQNARVKELRRAFSEAAPGDKGEVAIEGMHLVEEAIRAGLRLATVFFSESARERAHKLIPQLSSQTELLLLPEDVFSSAVPSETPQGVAAFVKVKTHGIDDVFAPMPALVVICRGITGPGQPGHDRPLGRCLRSDGNSAGRAHRQPVELEGGTCFGGIDVSPSDGEGRDGSGIARNEGAWSTGFGYVLT